MAKYQHWRNDHKRKQHRSRIHLATSPRETICGYNIKERELTAVSESFAKGQTIAMCSNCMQQLKLKDPESLKQYPHGKSRNPVSPSIQKKKKGPRQTETDKVCNPKLTKFKKIINSAKEKKLAIKNAIEDCLDEREEDNSTAIEKISNILPDLEMFVRVAQSEAQIEWEKDGNRFNDTKHFHIMTVLRNFALAIESIKDI